MLVTYQGSVNRWECDENDHQNVRFYIAKLNQSLVVAVQRFCLCEHEQAIAVLHNVKCHHIRFLQEARIAAPQVIETGVIAHEPAQRLELLSVMSHAVTQEPMASFVTHIDLSDFATDTVDLEYQPVPAEFSPRGVPEQTSAYAALDYAGALDVGFKQIGVGVFTSTGPHVLGHEYMGRLSDGMPNLWALFNTHDEMTARSAGEMGGAVLEYRMEFHHTMSAGQTYVHLAGIHTLGNKTMSICHLLFDVAKGQLALSAEALGISMDLQTRKSVAIPDARRTRITQLMLKKI